MDFILSYFAVVALSIVLLYWMLRASRRGLLWGGLIILAAMIVLVPYVARYW